MGQSYGAGFRRRAVKVAHSGGRVAAVAKKLGVSQATLYRWLAQERTDRGERPGLTSYERAELAQAQRRIRELETELEITRKASELFAEGQVAPKGNTR